MNTKSGASKPGDQDPEFLFLIDGKGYTDRDRELFVAGYEFAQNQAFLMTGSETAWPRVVHKENEFRLRNLVSKFGRTYKFSESDLGPGWITLHVGPVPESKKPPPPPVFVVCSGASSVLGVFISREVAEASFGEYDPVVSEVPLNIERRTP